MTLETSNFILMGAISGVIASIIFLLIHHLLISSIWFILPFGGLFGALTGGCLAWSYKIMFNQFNILNTVRLFGIFIIPVFLLEISTYLFLDRTYTLEEAMDPSATGPLLSLAFKIVIPFSLVYGLIQGYVLGGSRDLFLSSITTNFVIFTGIGHNLPIFNVVKVDDEWILLRIKLLTWLLLLVLFVSFAISFHFLMRTTKN